MSSQNISSLLLVFASCLLLASSNNAQRTEGGPSKGQKGEPASSEEQGPRGPRGEKGLPGDFFSDGPIRGRDGRDRDVDLEPLIRYVRNLWFYCESFLLDREILPAGWFWKRSSAPTLTSRRRRAAPASGGTTTRACGLGSTNRG